MMQNLWRKMGKKGIIWRYVLAVLLLVIAIVVGIAFATMAKEGGKGVLTTLMKNPQEFLKYIGVS